LVIKNKVVLGQRLNIYPALILIRDGRLATPRGRWLCLRNRGSAVPGESYFTVSVMVVVAV